MTWRAALALLTLTVAVTACRSEPPLDPEPDLLGTGTEYVALGDSYTAAPGIGPLAANDGCYRSQNNYPSLVAEATGADLVDRSCGGASTTSLTEPQLTSPSRRVQPQLDALGPGTDLVTLRIGGNDFGLFQLITRVCPTMAERDPTGEPCTEASNRAGGAHGLAALLRRLRGRLVAVLREIVERSPDAVVLVVGYPAVVPEDGRCEALPLAAGDYAFALRINQGFNDVLESAAETVDVPFVDIYSRTAGHDICSERPWIAGIEADRGRAVPWHPYAAEQRATADAILEEIDRG